jgi:hypothetical protein
MCVGGAVNGVVIPRPADAPKTARALHGTGNYGKVSPPLLGLPFRAVGVLAHA